MSINPLGRTGSSRSHFLKELCFQIFLIAAIGIIDTILLEIFPPLVGGIFAVCAVAYLYRRFLKNLSNSMHYNIQKEKSYYSSLYLEIEETEKLIKNYKFEDAIEKYNHILSQLRWKNSLYAKIKFNLGSAYKELASIRDNEINIALAIKCFEEALKKLKLKKYPNEYAKIQYNMGEAYSQLFNVKYKDNETNISKAIASYEEALKVFTMEQQPVPYAGAHIRLGKAFMKLSGIQDEETNISKAITAFENALKVCTIQNHKVDYAEIQSNLGQIYNRLAHIHDKEANTLKVIKAYEEALKVYEIDKYPEVYAVTQSNLGNAYGTLAQYCDKELNMKKALNAFEEALKIFSIEKHPDLNKQIRTNRAITFNQILKMKKDTKVEKSTVSTHETKKESLFEENTEGITQKASKYPSKIFKK